MNRCDVKRSCRASASHVYQEEMSRVLLQMEEASLASTCAWKELRNEEAGRGGGYRKCYGQTLIAVTRDERTQALLCHRHKNSQRREFNNNSESWSKMRKDVKSFFKSLTKLILYNQTVHEGKKLDRVRKFVCIFNTSFFNASFRSVAEWLSRRRFWNRI